MKVHAIWLVVGVTLGGLIAWPLSRGWTEAAKTGPSLDSAGHGNHVGQDDHSLPVPRFIPTPPSHRAPPRSDSLAAKRPKGVVAPKPTGEQIMPASDQVGSMRFPVWGQPRYTQIRSAGSSVGQDLPRWGMGPSRARSKFGDLEFLQPARPAPVASSASDWSVHLPTMLDLREGLRARYGLVAFFDGGGGSGIDAFFRAPIEDSAVPNQLPGVTSTAAANAALIEPPARDEPFAPQPNQSSLLDGAPSRFVDPSGPSIDQMVALAGFPGADTPFLPGHSPARDSMVYGPAQPGSVESPLYDAPAVPGAPEVRPPSGNAPGGGNPGMSTNPIPYDPKPLAEPEPLGRMVPEPGAICLLGLGGLLLGKRRR